MSKETNGLAIASLVLGLSWLISGFIFPFNPIIRDIFVLLTTILAMIFGSIAYGKTKNNKNISGKGMAIAGMVLGIIGFFIFIIGFIIGVTASIGG